HSAFTFMTTSVISSHCGLSGANARSRSAVRLQISAALRGSDERTMSLNRSSPNSSCWGSALRRLRHFTGRLVEETEVRAGIIWSLRRKQAALHLAGDFEFFPGASPFCFIFIFKGALQSIYNCHDDRQHDEPSSQFAVGNQRMMVESRSARVIHDPDDDAGETACCAALTTRSAISASSER